MLNFHAIVVTTDLSDLSLRALPYAVNLAERFHATLDVVHVNEPLLPVSELGWVASDAMASQGLRQVEAKTLLDKIVRERVPANVKVTAHVINGHPAEAIAEFARDHNSDLLITYTHGRTGISHALMGSVAEALVRRAPCPVLTVKQPMPVLAQ